jgi:hypothetical protein
LGRVVAFGVEEVGHLQDAAGTVGDTQLATLAALNDEMDFAAWDYHAILIERFTPEFHG